MRFVEAGKLSLETKVCDLIPAYGEKYPELSVLHLLNHSCGIGMTGMRGMMDAAALADPSDRLEGRVLKWAALEPDFAPGTNTGYSGEVGFDLLGRLLEIADGRELDEILADTVLQPLGMHDTVFVLNGEQKSRAASVFQDRTIERTPMFEAMGRMLIETSDASLAGYFAGSSGLWGCADDYDRLAQMYLNGGSLDGVRILKEETVRQMRTPSNGLQIKPDVYWGLGMQVFGDPKASGVFVNPGAFGWSGALGTHFFADPSAGVSFVLMLNADGLNGSESHISRKMEKILLENEA